MILTNQDILDLHDIADKVEYNGVTFHKGSKVHLPSDVASQVGFITEFGNNFFNDEINAEVIFGENNEKTYIALLSELKLAEDI